MMLPNQITLQTFTQTAKGGYKAVKAVPVDMFPKTAHVEGVGVLIKR